MRPITSYQVTLYLDDRPYMTENIQNDDSREIIEDRIESIFPKRKYSFYKYATTMTCGDC